MKRYNLLIFFLSSALFVNICFAQNLDKKNNIHQYWAWYKIGSFDLTFIHFFSEADFEYPKYSHHHYINSSAFRIIAKNYSGEISWIPILGFSNAAIEAEYSDNIKTSTNSDLSSKSELDIETKYYDKNKSETLIIFRTYGFSENFRNDFIISEFNIINLDTLAIDDLFLYYYIDPSISTGENNLYDYPNEYWRDDMHDYLICLDEICEPVENVYIMYMYDGDNPRIDGNDTGGLQGESQGYIGIITIQSPPTSNAIFPACSPSGWFDATDFPVSIQEIYLNLKNLSSDYTNAFIKPNEIPMDVRNCISWGPYNIAPGDSVKIVFGFGIGEGFENMVENLKWARRTYRSGFLSPVPVSPDFECELTHDGVKITWDVEHADYINPFTNRSGFSGYKLVKDDSVIYTISRDEINSGSLSFTDKQVTNGQSYDYAVINYLTDTDGKYYESSKNRFKTTVTFSYPDNFILYQNYPNPFNNETSIKAGLQDNGFITIKIYNVLGQLIRTLTENEYKNMGFYTYKWDGINFNGDKVSSGIYFYRLIIDNEVINTKKMLLVK